MSAPTLTDLWLRVPTTDAPACHLGERAVGWHELEQHVVTLAGALHRHAAQRWLLAIDDPARFAVGLFAVLHTGRTPIVPPNLHAGTVQRLRSTFDAILTDESSGDDRCAAIAPTLSVMDAAEPFALGALDAERAVVELYTSGSTGEPKCIPKHLRQLENEIAALEAVWGGALSSATVLSTVPHHHIYGLLFRLLWPLGAGRPFDNTIITNPNELRERLAQHAPTALISSPAFLSRLVELDAAAYLSPLPLFVFSSGGPLAPDTAQRLRAVLDDRLTEIYGSTESGGIAWRNQSGGEAAWRPLPGVRVTLAEDNALSVHSPFLPNNSALTMADAGTLLGDGRFLLRGRLDRTVKIEEKRVSLPEMEAWLGRHAWVREAAVVLLPGRRQQLGAAVVLSPEGRRQLGRAGRRELSQTLRAHLTDCFDNVVLPRRWRFPEAMPINERGKLTAVALAALFTEAVSDPAA